MNPHTGSSLTMQYQFQSEERFTKCKTVNRGCQDQQSTLRPRVDCLALTSFLLRRIGLRKCFLEQIALHPGIRALPITATPIWNNRSKQTTSPEDRKFLPETTIGLQSRSDEIPIKNLSSDRQRLESINHDGTRILVKPGWRN